MSKRKPTPADIFELCQEHDATPDKIKRLAQIDALKKLAAVDFQAALDMLPTEKVAETTEEGKGGPLNINSLLELAAGLKGGNNGTPEDRKNWTFKDWESKDSKGFAALLDKNPKEYIRLFKAEFNYEPTEAELKKV